MVPTLGILGGTFDPIHNGHVELAREVRGALSLAAVRLIPAGDPPHRAAPVATAAHRLEMVELAIEGIAGLEVDAREVDRIGRSYTIDTLESLRDESPHRPLALIVGADAFIGLPTWHRWRELFAVAHIVVVARPGVTIDEALGDPLSGEWTRRNTKDPAALADARGGHIFVQAITPHPISASSIRNALVDGNTIAVKGLLPPAVLAYIERNRLYRSRPDAT
jgi:nicotinate-nucleotide adenylyltransferase